MDSTASISLEVCHQYPGIWVDLEPPLSHLCSKGMVWRDEDTVLIPGKGMKFWLTAVLCFGGWLNKGKCCTSCCKVAVHSPSSQWLSIGSNTSFTRNPFCHFIEILVHPISSAPLLAISFLLEFPPIVFFFSLGHSEQSSAYLCVGQIFLGIMSSESGVARK